MLLTLKNEQLYFIAIFKSQSVLCSLEWQSVNKAKKEQVSVSFKDFCNRKEHLASHIGQPQELQSEKTILNCPVRYNCPRLFWQRITPTLHLLNSKMNLSFEKNLIYKLGQVGFTATITILTHHKNSK